MTLTLMPIRVIVTDVSDVCRSQAEDEKEAGSMTEPAKIVNDIIATHRQGKPLTEVWESPAEQGHDTDPFLDDLAAATPFEIYAYIALSILTVLVLGVVALVAYPVLRIRDRLTRK